MRTSGHIIEVLRRVGLGLVAACVVALAHPMLPGGGNAAVAPPATAPQATAPGAPRTPGFADLAQKVSPAVISIAVRVEEGANAKRRVGRSSGSGFFISADGYAVTNVHVVKPDRTHPLATRVKTAAGEMYDARVVGMDPLTDLALIKVDGRSDFPFVAFAETPPRVGDWVIAIGSPFGLATTVTTGIISGQGRDIGYGAYDFIQIDAPTNAGSSGGPTFDLDGKVIGVNTAIWQSPGDSGGFIGIGFAVPADTAKAIIAQLKERGAVARGWIGVPVQPVTPQDARRLGFKQPGGVLVVGVRRKDAGGAINADDIITSIDGQAVQDARDLARKTGAMAPGTPVKLGVLRNGQERTITVRLRDLADQAQPRGTADNGAKPDRQQADAARRKRVRSN
jgi:serine protease Do